MKRRPVIVFLGDGMADEPIPELGHKTPLQYAATPAMDHIAAKGRSGTLLTLPEGYPTSSDVANMSVLGCNLAVEHTGRGPLEAAGRGIELKSEHIAFRLNLVTVRNGILTDFSGGHIEQAAADEIIAALNDEYADETLRFHPGVSYRALMLLSDRRFSDAVTAEKPDDNHGNPIAEHLPKVGEPSAKSEETVQLMRHLMLETRNFLERLPVNIRLKADGRQPVNGLWPWSGGRAGSLHSLTQRYGVRGAVLSAVDVINGLGRCLGLDVINVPGATAYIDTNYEATADAAIRAASEYGFIYVHVEAPDEVSHERDLPKKLQAITDLDRRLIGRVIDALGDRADYAVLPDHPVPVRHGRHTRTPVPVSVLIHGVPPDEVKVYDEIACLKGALGAMKGREFMELLLGSASANASSSSPVLCERCGASEAGKHGRCR